MCVKPKRETDGTFLVYVTHIITKDSIVKIGGRSRNALIEHDKDNNSWRNYDEALAQKMAFWAGFSF